MPRLETPAVLRAIAIVLVVGTHANLFTVLGGAHLLLAVAGYNLARFQLADVPGRSRSRGMLKSAAQVVVPAALWIGAVGLITGGYAASTALLVNNFVGGARWSEQWQFWFLEAIVWAMLALAAVFADPAGRPARAAASVGLRARRARARRGRSRAAARRRSTPQRDRAVHDRDRRLVHRARLGRRAGRHRRGSASWRRRSRSSPCPDSSATRRARRSSSSACCCCIWVPRIPVARMLVPVIGVLAAASMFIYLTHWQVYPPLEDELPWLATLLSLAVGVAVWKGYSVVVARASRWLRRRRRPARPLRQRDVAAGG